MTHLRTPAHRRRDLTDRMRHAEPSVRFQERLVNRSERMSWRRVLRPHHAVRDGAWTFAASLHRKFFP